MNFWGSSYRYHKKAKKIIKLQETYRAMGDEELRQQTELFRQRLAKGESLRSLLVEAYAVVCEADFRVLHMRPFPVQVLGAVAMEYNNIVEMKTGEGKTLTATMPMYLHGLTGAGNFLITANGYLANRDAEQMGQVYRWLGLTVASGVAQPGHESEIRDRQRIYQADIVYTTNSALGFDYLFDNLAANPEEQYINHLNYALLDEADAILLDSAQTPLIIAGIPRVQSNYYQSADRMINMLKEKVDYKRSDDRKSVWFTPDGIKRMQHFFGVDDLLGDEWHELYRHLVLALKAHFIYKRDRDYVVDDDMVVLVDRDNGRELIGMKMQSGQHQAIEAKEHVKLTDEMRTMASVTYQNLFRMFGQLAGMTGTAATDAAEFMEVYRLAVYRVPTNEPMIRKDLPDQLYISQTAKLLASLKTVHKAYDEKRPILIETGSLSLSILYSRLLLREKIPHSLLNARSAAKEAKIVAEAGQLGAVTVATSMAGRGTDIKLGKGVKEKGGLLVLGTERMANRRVDNQLRGRAGRQGEPGSSIFYTSLEDRIVIQNAPKRVQKYAYKHSHDKHQQLSRHGRFHRVIDEAQNRVSNAGRSARFSTLQYDEVFRAQRDCVYATRDKVMVASSLERVIKGVFKRVAEDFVKDHVKDHRNGDISDFLDFVYTNIDRDYLPQMLEDHPNQWQDPTTVLWGQSIGLNAHLTPTNSTASVAWGTNAASGVGAFTNVNGRITSFKTEAPSGNTNAALQTNNGTPVTFTATATNDDKTTVSGKVQATIGGLNPLTVQRGTSFSVKPAALDGVTYPSKPTFKWHLYKDQKGSQDYSPVAGEQITNNTDTLNWQNIQAAAGTLYYQLEVEFDSGQKSYWYSNIAPLTITASAPQLHAVPNLQFALSSGANPSIADFYAAQGVTMVYQPSTIANQTNWDGNNHGALAIAGGGSTWSLNVQFSPFKNQTTQHYLSTETGGSAAVTLHFADGTAVQAKDNRQPVTVYSKVTKDVTTTTATTTSLQVPQTSTIQPGTYQSTATWTLVKAP